MEASLHLKLPSVDDSVSVPVFLLLLLDYNAVLFSIKKKTWIKVIIPPQVFSVNSSKPIFPLNLSGPKKSLMGEFTNAAGTPS